VHDEDDVVPGRVGGLGARLAVGAAPLQAQTREARFALVIGNDGYAAPLPTAANDAGLIADTSAPPVST